MRTTLDIDADVMAAVKDIARRENKSMGKALSDLVRLALIQGTGAFEAREPSASFHGFRPFPSRDAVVDNETIDRLRDEEGL